MDEDNDRVALVRNPSKQETQQKFVVSDEVTHIEERVKRMGDLEVHCMTMGGWSGLGGVCSHV